MASYVKTLKDERENTIYPQTLASAVITTGGTDIESAIASKADASAVSSKITVGNVTPSDLTAAVFAAIYPIGSIYMSTTMSTAAQVATAFGGTWVAWGAGKVPVGVDTSDTDFDSVEETGGEKTHTLTITEIPAHTHALMNVDTGSGSIGKRSGTYYNGGWWGNYTDTTSVGGSGSHNNLQPYITCYMYKRTA